MRTIVEDLRSTARRSVYWLQEHAALVILLLVAVGFIYADAQDKADLRDGCERQNVRTQLQYDKYLADEEESRAFSDQQEPGPVKRITLRAADQYAHAASQLVALVEEDGVALEPGSPQTDCGAVYEPPFPLNLFD